ncbi:tigger transposable element-derived protein 1 [Trichonephila clavipes]|nr:tigger transposable element-derived protein 1 [Trichonephila clavipes]
MQRCFDIHLWISLTPNAAVLFADGAIQPEVRFIAKQNSLLKIGNNGNLVLDPFDESTPCLMIVLMNCQTKLRINHLTAVKSVAILERESATADEGAAKIFPEKLAKIIEDGDYSADQVFNADETGLNWKKMPNRTYIAKDEKTASGHKASKDRVTLLLCSNASGDRMLKPLLINKSLRPRALKGKDLKQLPVHWMANPKSWMTTAIFTEWFNNCFVT